MAYYLHWNLDAILDLEHGHRQRVIEEIGGIHRQLSAPPH